MPVEDLPGDFPVAADSRAEDVARAEWVLTSVRNRPRPFQSADASSEVRHARRLIAQLRGTGELYAVIKLLFALLEKAEARGDGYAHGWRR